VIGAGGLSDPEHVVDRQHVSPLQARGSLDAPDDAVMLEERRDRPDFSAARRDAGPREDAAVSREHRDVLDEDRVGVALERGQHRHRAAELGEDRAIGGVLLERAPDVDRNAIAEAELRALELGARQARDRDSSRARLRHRGSCRSCRG
jgi:hypothetical protein